MPVRSMAGDAPVPSLSSSTDVATAGYFSLSWQQDIGAVEIQEATNKNFTNPETLLPGNDSATVISGKSNGDWYYRLRFIENHEVGTWSQPIRVTVQHHSLTRAAFFFSLGLIMFIATCLLILRGEKLS